MTPAQPCLHPGCPNLSEYRGRCREHATEHNRDTHRTGRLDIHSGRLEPTSGRLYDRKRWDKLRERRLYLEPLCRACLQLGEDSLATEVDHIIPVENGGDPWSLENTQALCRSHHASKTRREQLAGRD